MPETSTEKFLRLVNEANCRIAERQEKQESNGIDPVRLELDKVRRERAGGTLRAREHPRSRPIKARQINRSNLDPS